MTVRVNVLPSGLLDELVVSDCDFEIRRTGQAKYRLTARPDPADPYVVDLWTSKLGTIKTVVRDIEAWVTVYMDADGSLRILRAADCGLHLEQMTRGNYWMGLDRADSHVHVNMSTSGYLKARIVNPGDDAS